METLINILWFSVGVAFIAFVGVAYLQYSMQTSRKNKSTKVWVGLFLAIVCLTIVGSAVIKVDFGIFPIFCCLATWAIAAIKERDLL